jgi:hypothetical protein
MAELGVVRICQARDATNATTRSYYAEGELVPGSPAQPYYYGPDQIGSVRRAFASTTNAPAYGYDPYCNALQVTAPVRAIHSVRACRVQTQKKAMVPATS